MTRDRWASTDGKLGSSRPLRMRTECCSGTSNTHPPAMNFFGTLLNIKSPDLVPDITERRTQRPVTAATCRLAESPTLAEVEWAVESLLNWKAPSHVSFPAELLKVDEGEPIVPERLLPILVDVWNGSEIPREWENAPIKVLYKKGYRLNCNNCRGAAITRRQGSSQDHHQRLSAYCEANDLLRRLSVGFDLAGLRSVCCS